MKRAVLFRFNTHPIVCKNRIRLIRKFNPGMEVFGIFGGEEDKFPKFKRVLKNDLDHIYCISGKTDYWKWANGDLATRLWYNDYGKNVSFDMLHIIEWDLLLLGSISKIYKHIPEMGVGLTGLTLLEDIEKKWTWTSKEPYKTEWLKLLYLAKKKFGYNKKPRACIFPGTCLPRAFLKKYSKISIPKFRCHDELRLPLFAQISGFKLYDTGFYRKWFDKKEEAFFSADSWGVQLSIIKNELSKPIGRRVFHPYNKIFRLASND